MVFGIEKLLMKKDIDRENLSTNRSFLRPGYYSYGVLTHDKRKYRISTLFLSHSKAELLKKEKMRYFQEKMAKIGKILVF